MLGDIGVSVVVHSMLVKNKCTFILGGLILISLLSSCRSDKLDNKRIVIDLMETEESIRYSSFVDSVSYLTFHFDDIPIAGIEKIYKKDGYYYIWGEQSAGIFIFNESGRLYSHINCYGEGPEEFRMISSFSVVGTTGDVCVLDYASQQTKYYSKEGTFKYSIPFADWSIDIAPLSEDCIVFLSPFYAPEGEASGIWVADGQNRKIKQLSDDVTENHKFYYYPMTYNRSDSCLYYYDRNWDYFSRISEDSMEVMHQFHIEQKLPASLMGDIHAPLTSLNGYAICDRFLYSPSRLLLSYCIFNYTDKSDNRTHVWGMLDNRTHQIQLAKNLHNDLDGMGVTSNQFFHLDNQTWAYVCDNEEDSFDIRLQLLHVKNE